jgi:threonine synthase
MRQQPQTGLPAHIHPERLRDGPYETAATTPVRKNDARCQCPIDDQEVTLSYVRGLRCRECDQTYSATAIHVCEFCFGPLEVDYDYEAIAKDISREAIASRRPSLWRYKELLPADGEAPLDLGAGFTPLVRADRLAAELGLGELWIKNDTLNPTGSFKDRVVSVALTKALELGFKVAACASTGNLGNSVAAHAAHAGLKSYVFIPKNLEKGKVLNSAIYGTTLVGVDGNYDDINRLTSELSDDQPTWAFVNQNVRPYYSEGSKTLAFEVAEQLGWEAPDHVIIPVASGSQLIKTAKGYRELAKVGLIDEKNVRISGAQAAGCAPVAEAFATGVDFIKPVKPQTIAKSIAIGNPADGAYVLDEVRSSGGGIAAVCDEDIVDGIRLLARTEGIFAETAGGTTVAALAKLAQQGVVRKDERVVIHITGHGLKTVEAVAPYSDFTVQIQPTLDAVRTVIESQES